MTWDDARNKSVPDLAGFSVNFSTNPGVFTEFTPLILTAGNYGYTDVLVSSSSSSRKSVLL